MTDRENEQNNLGKFKAGDFVSVSGAIYEVLAVQAEIYVLQLREFSGEEVVGGPSLAFPLQRENELRRAFWPRVRSYRGYVIELQETYSGFRAHALPAGTSRAGERELVAGVIGEDPDEVFARMKEIIDDELGSDSGVSHSNGNGH